MLELYGVLILWCIIAFILKSATVKGFIGEKTVSTLLGRLEKQKYRVLNDLLIPTATGNTSQIDHVIVSEYGIFVIETKNYKGWIYGDEDSQYWTQVIYK
ncbi:nuclease-related domain-containing protein [Brevibacillus choshinensis]|uniref:nuclease-related domain-containing protein n=1 Tax=Brevibacillus choshinensis TaxID=54911 RepID=UPI002E1F09A8|nr:nuclease-related domain-containing protein [Brevibacillus choshinensis]